MMKNNEKQMKSAANQELLVTAMAGDVVSELVCQLASERARERWTAAAAQHAFSLERLLSGPFSKQFSHIFTGFSSVSLLFRPVYRDLRCVFSRFSSRFSCGKEKLGRLGRPQADPAVAALLRCAGDEDDDVRCAAARALGHVGALSGSGLPWFSIVFAWIFIVFHQFSSMFTCFLRDLRGSDACATTLMALLSDPDGPVRWGACEALGNLGAASSCALRQLQEALEDEEERV